MCRGLPHLDLAWLGHKGSCATADVHTLSPQNKQMAPGQGSSVLVREVSGASWLDCALSAPRALVGSWGMSMSSNEPAQPRTQTHLALLVANLQGASEHLCTSAESMHCEWPQLCSRPRFVRHLCLRSACVSSNGFRLSLQAVFYSDLGRKPSGWERGWDQKAAAPKVISDALLQGADYHCMLQGS